MMSSYFTILRKPVICPQFNETVYLSAKYRLTDNPENTNEVVFLYATCPIIENSKLSIDAQCEEYKYLRCLQSSCDYSRISRIPGTVGVIFNNAFPMF